MSHPRAAFLRCVSPRQLLPAWWSLVPVILILEGKASVSFGLFRLACSFALLSAHSSFPRPTSRVGADSGVALPFLLLGEGLERAIEFTLVSVVGGGAAFPQLLSVVLWGRRMGRGVGTARGGRAGPGRCHACLSTSGRGYGAPEGPRTGWVGAPAVTQQGWSLPGFATCSIGHNFFKVLLFGAFP